MCIWVSVPGKASSETLAIAPGTGWGGGGTLLSDELQGGFLFAEHLL